MTQVVGLHADASRQWTVLDQALTDRNSVENVGNPIHAIHLEDLWHRPSLSTYHGDAIGRNGKTAHCDSCHLSDTTVVVVGVPQPLPLVEMLAVFDAFQSFPGLRRRNAAATRGGDQRRGIRLP